MKGKGMGIIILVIAGIAAAFYFLKGKIGRAAEPQAIKSPATTEKRHTPVKEKPTKSQQEIKKKIADKKMKKKINCHNAYSMELFAAKNVQERAIARNNLAACIAAAQR